MKHLTKYKERGARRQEKGNKPNSEAEEFNSQIGIDKAEAKIEFYKRIQSSRRAKRIQMEIYY